MEKLSIESNTQITMHQYNNYRNAFTFHLD